MQHLARYVLEQPQGGAAAFDDAAATVTSWLADRGTRVGEEAAAEPAERIDDGERRRWRISEPHLGEFRFLTAVTLSRCGADVGLTCTLGLQGPAFRRADPHVHAPRLIRDLVGGNPAWRSGGDVVQRRPEIYGGRADGRRLGQIVFEPRRSLPLVVISEWQGEPPAPGFDQKAVDDLIGLARVVRIDSEAAYGLSEAYGKEWSCYNGAVRLYWPGANLGESFYQHPLWIDLPNRAGGGVRLRAELRALVFPTTVYSLQSSTAEQEFAAERRAGDRRRRLDELRRVREAGERAGRARSDAELLDELLEHQELVEQLTADIEELKRERDELKRENYSLSLRGAAPTAAASAAPEEDEPAPPPETVADAVALARIRHRSALVFGADVDRGVRDLRPDAGPPGCVLQYLDALAELSAALKLARREKRGLGQSAKHFLGDRLGPQNVSGESETGRSNRRLAQATTFDDGDERRRFEMHLKPTDATSHDRCVRIYFDAAKDPVIVGWVGRHPGKK